MHKIKGINISDWEKFFDGAFKQNPKIELSQINNCETPEDIFDSYEKSRSLKDYQKLWNLGIKLHEIRGNQWVECDYFDPRPEQSFIKVYDMIDGRLKFTKIGVYEIKK